MQAFILVINLACMEQKFCPILGETNGPRLLRLKSEKTLKNTHQI